MGYFFCFQLSSRELDYATVAVDLHIVVQYPLIFVHGNLIHNCFTTIHIADAERTLAVLVERLSFCM